VEVVKFLSERALAFRGSTEEFGRKDNGNYLGTLELLAKFDPFLANHIEKFGNKGRGNVSYLSSTICEEFINILAEKVKHFIREELRDAKYYSVSIDSTPDLSHIDQLAVIIRYVRNDGNPIERFMTYINIHKHDGKYLYETLKSFLADNGIDLANCRGQTYDNASNMSGCYAGVQALLRQDNDLAEWVPCSAHSLNLIGTSAAECCPESIRFFNLVQNIYTFLSASPRRWECLNDNLPKKSLVPKALSTTRWSARADAVKALAENYQVIKQTLSDIKRWKSTIPTAAVEADGLIRKMDNLE